MSRRTDSSPPVRPRRHSDGALLDSVLSPLRHELRNTLSPIMMMVDVLVMRQGGPELDTLVREVRLLSLLFDDLASLTRATHGKLEVAKQAIDLADLVAGVVAETKVYLDQLGATLAVTVPSELRVTANATWLALALASILRHVATPTARLVVETEPHAKMVTLRFRSDQAPLPDDRALAFARHLLELQDGRWKVGDDLEISLPIAAIE